MPLIEEPEPDTRSRSSITICRTCWRGVLTLDEAQARLGEKYTAIEVRPAQCCGNEGEPDLVPATEVLFVAKPFGGTVDEKP